MKRSDESVIYTRLATLNAKINTEHNSDTESTKILLDFFILVCNKSDLGDISFNIKRITGGSLFERLWPFTVLTKTKPAFY